jgi:Tol biopolymer transport system component
LRPAAVRRRRRAAALAIAALLVVATLPALWDRSAGRVWAPLTRAIPTERIVANVRPDVAPRPEAVAPAFASAGTPVFQSEESGADRSILRITRVVGGDASNLHARSSPDGKQIAFDSDREGERAIFIADADGRNVRRVSGEGFAALPSWSPDGRLLAHARAEPDRPEVWNLWIVKVSTAEARRLTSHRSGQTWGASWFPDGRRVAYSHEARLIVLDLAAAAERVFTFPVDGRRLHTPAVSPDGGRVIVQVERDGAWLLELGDGSRRRVVQDPAADDYAWAPDGRRVAYHSRSTGKWSVWVMAPQSSPVDR